jgi:hypothetical protein
MCYLGRLRADLVRQFVRWLKSPQAVLIDWDVLYVFVCLPGAAYLFAYGDAPVPAPNSEDDDESGWDLKRFEPSQPHLERFLMTFFLLDIIALITLPSCLWLLEAFFSAAFFTWDTPDRREEAEAPKKTNCTRPSRRPSPDCQSARAGRSLTITETCAILSRTSCKAIMLCYCIVADLFFSHSTFTV